MKAPRNKPIPTAHPQLSRDQAFENHPTCRSGLAGIAERPSRAPRSAAPGRSMVRHMACRAMPHLWHIMCALRATDTHAPLAEWQPPQTL